MPVDPKSGKHLPYTQANIKKLKQGKLKSAKSVMSRRDKEDVGNGYRKHY